jgi:hypothetical protein
VAGTLFFLRRVRRRLKVRITKIPYNNFFKAQAQLSVFALRNKGIVSTDFLFLVLFFRKHILQHI